MDSNTLLLAAVPVLGFAAGFINTLAGNGSMITLPLLILLGLPANVANGTNRVGVVVQNIVAVGTFRRRGALDLRGSWRFVAPSVLGAVVGAALAVDLDEALLRRTIGVLMLLMLGIMLMRPGRWLAAHSDGHTGKLWVQVPVFFAIGIYGGFLQAGVGIFLIAALVLGAGHDLVRANALKNLIVLVFTVAALGVFVVNDQVDWGLGALLALGQAAGAWVAARTALARGATFVHWTVIGVLVVSSLALILDIGV